MTAAEQPTEVDPSIDFGAFDDRPAANCQDPPRSESCLVGTPCRPASNGLSPVEPTMASRLSANGPALRVSLNASWLGFYTTPVKLSCTRRNGADRLAPLVPGFQQVRDGLRSGAAVAAGSAGRAAVAAGGGLEVGIPAYWFAGSRGGYPCPAGLVCPVAGRVVTPVLQSLRSVDHCPARTCGAISTRRRSWSGSQRSSDVSRLPARTAKPGQAGARSSATRTSRSTNV